MKKSRTPFAGRAKNVAGSRFTIEEFWDKDVRDARFRALREQGTPNVTKFSTGEEQQVAVVCR